MWPFGTPNIEKLKEQGDIKGLVKALSHRKKSVRDAAASALAEFEDLPEGQAILSEFRQCRSRRASAPPPANRRLVDAIRPRRRALWRLPVIIRG